MTKFEVLSTTVSSQYEYINDTMKVTGSYSKDAASGTVNSVQGQMYGADDAHYIGNFRGDVQNGKMKYSLSGVDVEDGAAAWQAIGDISARINSENDSAAEAAE